MESVNTPNPWNEQGTMWLAQHLTILQQLAGGLRAADGLYRQPQHLRSALPLGDFVSGAGRRDSYVHDVSITREAPNYRVF